MRVEELLNPAYEQEEQSVPDAANALETPRTPEKGPKSLPLPPLGPLQAQVQSPSPSRTRSLKPQKNAPIFRKAPTKGVVQFLPHEAGNDKELAKQYELFQIFPRGEIAEHCHHIPYSSDKKTFLNKTGRDAFEVFQYTFKVPGEEREHAIMWDYNIGLVRITPFFKCCNYSKTTPAKVLNVNPGLRDITHSITGGALAAQGYWMPFDCAKAVTATFCFNIRYALVPIFGKDFPAKCIHPSELLFANFRIDAAIVQACTVETQAWLRRADARLTPSISSREPSEAPLTPQIGTPGVITLLPAWKKLKPKQAGETTSPESGYATDTDLSDAPPGMSPKTSWAPINGAARLQPASISASTAAARAAEGLLMLSSPTAKSLSTPFKTSPRQLDVASQATPQEPVPRTVPGKVLVTENATEDVHHSYNFKRLRDEVDEDYETEDSELSDGNGTDKEKPRLSEDGEGKQLRQNDSTAAYLLLQLRSREPCLDTRREKRPRFRSVPDTLP